MIGFILLVSLLTATHASSGPQLNYNEQNHWGGVCTTGIAQSPINVPAPSRNVRLPTSTKFIVLPKSTFTMTNLNNANTVKYALPSGTKATIPWLQNRKITLVQLHLHWGKTAAHGSEHMIRGKAYAAESHLVTSYTDFDGTTKYTVIARLFQLGAANPQIAQMIEKNKAHSGSRNMANFNLSALYPANAVNWMTYHGGLTTPPCTEIVHWVIITQPLTISAAQLNALRKMNLGSGHTHPLNRNWRKTQSLNGRVSTSYHRG